MNEKEQNPGMQVLTGQHWGQYRILGPVGQGRYSTAYIGTHTQHPSKQLVVETFPLTLTVDKGMVFLQSGHALMRLVHPSILRLFDVGLQNATPFIVLDYIPHTPLRRLYLRGQGQPLEKLLPYLHQIASALQYAHANGRVHKHLRPDNVLLGLGTSYTVFLCDFAIDGIDKNEQFQNYQRRMLPIEPLTYMAPEQIQLQAMNASDQYALGTMIYEWLCGTPPFLGNPTEIAQQQLHSAPPSLRQRVPSISPNIEEIVMMALNKEPGRRFADVSAFVNALERAHKPVKQGEAYGPAFAAGGHAKPLSVTPFPETLLPITPPSQPAIVGPISVEVSPNPSNVRQLTAPNSVGSAVPNMPPATSRQQKQSNATRRAFLVSVAVVAAVGGGGTWLLWKRLRPTLQASPPNNGTTTPPALAPDQPVVYRMHTARVNAVTWSPDGQKIASAGDDKLVLICDLAGKTLLTYAGHQDQVNAVAWSPDGQHIASGSADKTVQIWDATNGTLVFTYTGHTAAINAVSWSLDNRLVASGSDDTTVQAWFATTGEVFLTYSGHTSPVTSVAWSPLGTKIASGSWDNTLQVCSAVQNEAFAVGEQVFSAKIHGEHVVYAVAWSPDGTLIASGGGDNLMQICDGITGSTDEVGYKSPAVPRHSKPVRSVAWSPDGKLIVSGGDDKVARIWDAATGKPRASFAKHTDSVLAVDWSPDSKLISSGSADTTMQIWKSA